MRHGDRLDRTPEVRVIDRQEEKPAQTTLLKLDVFVEYKCEDEPSVSTVVYRGMKQFGFIWSHQYDVQVKVERVLHRTCELDECAEGHSYAYWLHYYVYETVGLGFGAGPGTGTWGWTKRVSDYTKSYESTCFCCEPDDIVPEPLSDAESLNGRFEPRADAQAIIVGSLSVTALSIYALVNFGSLAGNLTATLVVAPLFSSAILSGIRLARGSQLFARSEVRDKEKLGQ